MYPAKISDDGNDIKPFLDKGIIKKNLIIRNAWEIGENDIDRVVINRNDRPIIPDGNTDAPILKIIENAKST